MDQPTSDSTASDSPTAAAPQETSALPVAAFWRRALATLFDALFVLVVVILLLAVRGGFFLERFAAPIGTSDTTEVFQNLKHEALFSGLSVVGVILFYFFVLETCFAHGTLGKMILNIRVASLDAGKPRFVQVLIRFVSKFTIGPLTLGLSWIAALFSKRRQAWHDRLAGTIVVLSPPQ